MIGKRIKWVLSMLCLFPCAHSFAQTQACPVNINFSSGFLTHWYAYTGNNQLGNGPSAIKVTYDSLKNYPAGTLNTATIDEYNLSGVSGIQVATTTGTDPFGGFPTIPTINGYAYSYSILLGSTSITRSQARNGPPPGGYIRGISYKINVPAGPVTEPYTMTYAYAMVLENGSHNSNDQPLFSATLKTSSGIISCASPSYYLPTLNNATSGGGDATLDSATAKSNGFSVSSKLSPHPNPNGTPGNEGNLQDVWTKAWTEVTFDLSPYREQTVTLTFEADNCVPGGHFAYAYVALRNVCAGLAISGDTLACANSNLTYSVPALAGATYQWYVPTGWTITSGANSNIITVAAGAIGGKVVAKEQNSCANLQDTIQVKTAPPSVGGVLTADATVCAGINSSPLSLTGNTGAVTGWVASQDGGLTWAPIADLTSKYTAQNLDSTTIFKAVVQNSAVCQPDSSSPATIIVDQKSIGGTLDPANNNFCAGQTVKGIISLTGNRGDVENWQSSLDSTNWFNVNPKDKAPNYDITGISTSTQFRVVVKNGVCDADTSSIAFIRLFPAAFPQATISPSDTTICYGANAQLSATITTGTNYSWSNYQGSSNPAGGNIASTPYSIATAVSPPKTTDYLLNVENTGCPNILTDTFHINVIPPIIVNAGNDTSIVINQPLQLQATSNDTTGDAFLWTPATGLNNTGIADPIATLGLDIDSIRYTVTATDMLGCFGVADIVVKVFKTAPDIFVPNAFSPDGTSNRVFRPIPVGISAIQFFRVYNRWGQLVYSTSRIGDGWDGTFGGKQQSTGSFVWMVQGTAYTGKTIFRKGTMTLIR